MNRPTLLHLILLTALTGPGCAGFGTHADLVVADAKGQKLEAAAVRVTYLGCNGYLLESAVAAVLIDPFVSRSGLWHTAFDQPITSDPEIVSLVTQRVPGLAKPIKAILITHGHYDHLLDAGAFSKQTGAKVFGSPTSCYLAMAQGADPKRVEAVRAGQTIELDGVRIDVLKARHDTICCGNVPFPGKLDRTPEPPTRPSHWVLGRPLAFSIRMAGKHIYIDSGGHPDQAPPTGRGRVDLAILGVALGDSRNRYADYVRTLKPAVVLPSHQDDFFRPLADGFYYGPLTDPGGVRRIHERQQLPGRLILLDYFHPWTLR